MARNRWLWSARLALWLSLSLVAFLLMLAMAMATRPLVFTDVYGTLSSCFVSWWVAGRVCRECDGWLYAIERKD